MIDSPTVILVVEDEALLRLLLMEVLEEAGFAVIEARTADDAVLLLAHRGYSATG
jgi:two-component system, response regulator PdtaR